MIECLPIYRPMGTIVKTDYYTFVLDLKSKTISKKKLRGNKAGSFLRSVDLFPGEWTDFYEIKRGRNVLPDGRRLKNTIP